MLPTGHNNRFDSLKPNIYVSIPSISATVLLGHSRPSNFKEELLNPFEVAQTGRIVHSQENPFDESNSTIQTKLLPQADSILETTSTNLYHLDSTLFEYKIEANDR